MPRLELRPYQEECVQAHFTWFANNPEGNPLFVVPTGAGKSLIIAEFVRRSLEAWPSCRFVVPTHVKELVQQNYDEFVGHWGGGLFCPVGIYSAGLGRRDARERVVFANIQSIYGRAEELGPFDLVLVDEAHLVPKTGEGRYRTYFEALRAINPRVRVCGYTATHYRLDGGYLHKGDDAMFTAVAYEVRLEDLVPEYLCPLVAKAPKEGQVDLAGVRTEAGEFKADDLEAASLPCTEAAVDEVVELGQHRKAWLFFATTIRHAELVVSALADHGIEARAVFGDTPADERASVVRAFRDGDLRAIVNVGVLTTGFNAPRCDLIAMLRATQSASLYVQICGRGMRKFPGKTDCMLLDFGGNVQRHGPINKVRPRPRGEGGGVLARLCPECDMLVALGALVCPCGHVFTRPCPLCDEQVPLRTRTCPHCGYESVREHEPTASDLAPWDPGANEPTVCRVSSWNLRRHEKPDRPPSVRVDYYCGMKTYSEWVCPEHGGYAARKAGGWWTDHGGAAPLPSTVDDLLARAKEEIRQPAAIEVVLDGEYDRVSRSLYRREATT